MMPFTRRREERGCLPTGSMFLFTEARAVFGGLREMERQPPVCFDDTKAAFD